MHIANQHDNFELAELLIQSDADVNKIDQDGRTELHYSIEYGRKNMTKLLIDYAAITNVMDKDGDTPLKLANFRSNINMIHTDSLE